MSNTRRMSTRQGFVPFASSTRTEKRKKIFFVSSASQPDLNIGQVAVFGLSAITSAKLSEKCLRGSVVCANVLQRKTKPGRSTRPEEPVSVSAQNLNE